MGLDKLYNGDLTGEDVVGRMLRTNRALSEAEEKLSAKVAALGTLHETGRILTSAQHPDDLYQKVADVLVDRMNYEVGLVVGWDPAAGSSGSLVVHASCACTRAHLSHLAHQLDGLDTPRLLDPDTQAQIARTFAVPLLFVVPVPRRSKLPPVAIIVGRCRDGRNEQDDQELLRTLAGQVGVGLDNHALFAQLAQEKSALETAQAQLVGWAETLEERVADRTAQIERRNRQLATLNRVSEAINASLDPATMSQSVLRLTGQMLGARTGVVWLCSAGQPATLPAHFGLPRRLHQALERGGAHDGSFLDQYLSAGRVVSVDAGDDAPGTGARLARRLGLQSLVVVPVRARNEVIGLMLLGIAQAGALDHEDITLLNVLGEQFGVGISNARTYEDALHRAERDPVTSLFNHRALQQRLGQEMQRADREKTTVAVVLMDLDNFKFFNDAYGHLCGDEVLRLVARHLEAVCRHEGELGGRYGGDEFMLVLPGADRQRAATVAQTLRASLAQAGYRPPGEERPVPLAMSYGLAVYPMDAAARHDLLCLADTNLYQSKSGGGNAVSASSARSARARRIAGYDMLDSLVRTVDNKDRYTRRHSEDVADYACRLGRALGLDDEALETLSVAGLLHDVGKISVPDTILRKPGRLTSDEMLVVQSHPTVGALIVGAVPALNHILPAVRHHHERWDGTGYPDGLAGADIPLIARIMAVADAFSAMTTDRPYRNSLQTRDALDAIRKGAGTQFDPALGARFVEALGADEADSLPVALRLAA